MRVKPPLYYKDRQLTGIMAQSQQSLSVLSSPRSSVLSEAKRSFFIVITVNLVHCLLRLALLLTLITLWANSNIHSFMQQASYQRMQETVALWQKQVIVEFRVVNTLNCPQNYQEYTDYLWPGITEGCICSTKLDTWSYQVVLRGRCSEGEVQRGCLSIPEQDSALYAFWKKSAHLCVRRLKNYNFYSKKEDIWNPNGLPQSYCGQGQQFQIDLISAIECPITTISNNSDLSESISGLGFSFQRSNDYPIAQLVLTQYSFCEDYSQDSISPARYSNYILEKKTKSICSAYDARTVVLDEQDQVSLLENNPKILSQMMKLPSYPPINSRYKYQLGFRRYPPWSYSCRMSADLDLITATGYLSLTDLLNFYNKITIGIYTLLIFQLVFMLFYWSSAYLYYREREKQGYLYLKDYQIKKLNPKSNLPRQVTAQFLKFILLQAVTATLLILCIAVYSKASLARQWYNQALKCTSSLFQVYLNHYEQFFGALIVRIITFIFIAVGVIVIDFAHLLWRRWKGDLQEQDNVMPERNEGQFLSQYKPKNLAQTEIEVTEECLVANAGPQEELDQDLVRSVFGVKARSTSLFYFQQSSQYSQNESNKSD